MSKVGTVVKGVCFVIVGVIASCLVVEAFLLNFWVGVIVLVLGILLIRKLYKRLPASLKKTPRDLKQSANPRIEEKSRHRTEGNSQYIDERYFDQISKAVDDLMREYEFACYSEDFEKEVEDCGYNFQVNGNKLQNATSKIQWLFWIDMVRCYKGLGLPCDTINKTSYGLYYFIERTWKCERLQYWNYRKLYLLANHALSETIIKGINDPLNEIPKEETDTFFVAHVLGRMDERYRQRYVIKLYRFASIVAKADNVVTDKESAWLSSIMQLQSGGVNTRFYDNDDERETVYRNSSLGKDVSAELNGLVGLGSVKREVEALSDFILIQNKRQQKGMKVPPTSYHCVFTGNPGTGKTTVARILAKIYKNLGVVSKGHLVETDRSGLVAEYVGQTAVKTNKVIDKALDGILFIDEAYSLVGGGEMDYGREAVATLLKRMEDDRKRLVVILAGYTNEMKAFIDSNPGLQSRFSRYIEFPDYNTDELYQIFLKQLKEFDYTITPDAEEALKVLFAYHVAHKDANFGNARFVRNVFERTLQRQATRLSKEVNLTSAKLAEITKEDLPEEL